MKYKAYPSYKDSGVEWLGKVPEHWDITVIKRAFDVKLGKMLQPSQKSLDDNLKNYLKASSFTWNGVTEVDNQMWFSSSELQVLRLREGDLLIAEGGDVGKSCIFDRKEELYYQNSINRARAINGNINKFLYYWLFMIKHSGYIDILCNKATIAHYTSEKVKETILLLPKIKEQQQIAAFLDKSTGKIDELISKQERLISIVKEKAVTLAMNEQMNGLGEQVRIRNLVQTIFRPVDIVQEEEYVALGLYNRGRGLFQKPSIIGKDIGDSSFFYVKEDDLILSGQFAWEGAVAMASAKENGCVVSHRFPILRGKSVCTEYLLALFMTDFGDFLLNENSRGAAGRNRPLNINLLLNEKIRVPSIDVQKQIKNNISLLSDITEKAKKQIELLKEKRTALISAAVTGKIDVREIA